MRLSFRHRLAVGCATWIACLLLGTGVAHAQGVLCTCDNKYFDRPGNCMQECRKKLTCSGCMVTGKNCAPLADNTFKRLYNQAVFGLGLVGGGPARLALVNQIVDTFYRPHRHTDFDVRIGNVAGGDDYAKVVPPASGSRPSLVVSPDALLISPAGLVSAIGHEMIHVEQLKRPSRVRVTYITPVITSLRELEASSWEVGEGGFNWSIGPNRVYSCEPADEKEAPPLVRRCRAWQVKKAIENVRSSPRAAQTLKELESWMREDAWVNTVWLPRNAGWKTAAAGARPDDQCPNP